MEDQEKALNSVDLSSVSAVRNYSGAGANAVSRADRVLVTTPLSEVVWSPRKGLCFKCVEHSLTEKKAPILWSTEILNIIISPPPTAGGGKSDSSKFMTGGDSTKIYLQAYSEDKICKEVASLGSPQNSVSVAPSCPMWSPENSSVLELGYKSISPGTLQGMKTMKNTPLTDITRGDYPRDNKDTGASSPRKNQKIANNARASNAANSEGETGSEDGRTADRLSQKPEVASNLAKVEAENKNSSRVSLKERIERDLGANTRRYLAKDETLIYDAPLFNKWNCPEDLECSTKFKGGKQAQSEDIANEDWHNGLTSHFTCLHPLAEKRAQTSDLKECNYLECQEEKNPLIGSSLNASVNPLAQCEGKEKISSTERMRSVSTEKDDNNGSVRSSNSAEPFVTGKRGRGFGEIFIGSKRMKKSSDENSCSGPHVKEDSSFRNWISNVTKGIFRSDHLATRSLVSVPNLVPNEQRGLFSTSTSNDSDSVAARGTVGFGSIFKAFYWPRLTGKSKKIANADLGESANFKELQLENLTNGRNTNRVNHDNKGIILHKPIPISSVRVDRGICQFGEPPPVVQNISVINSHIQEKVKDNIQEHCNLHNVGSSSSSLHNASSSPSAAKDNGKVGPFILKKSSSLSIMNKVGGIPASVWITRFLPKVAAQTECTTQCNQDAYLESEKHVNECNVLPRHSQNGIDPVKGSQNSEDRHRSPLGDQKPTSLNSQQYSVRPMGLACSKTKSNLNPILPSQKLKMLEPMTSVFAKRLDAFRHIQTSEGADDTAPENVTCLFCRKNGHFITSCSDITDSELEDLLKNTNSLGRTEKSACLCIRCYQHTHWAVACPYASLCSYQHVEGNASIINCESFSRTTKRSDAPLLSPQGVRRCEKSAGRQQQVLSAHGIHCGNMTRSVTEFMFQTSTVDKKSAMKGKQMAATSGEAELGDKSFAHFDSLVIKKKPDEQERIFERIRMLRLSRADIIRWMESSISHFSLEGFFLRVRLGKCEEGQGGTCYHVAFISGPSGINIHGGGKSRLPVNIGGSKCLIDCCFISNHDFLEDELKAWWTMTLLKGGQLPSEVELDKKLRERGMLDL